MSTEAPTLELKETINLPKTKFAQKANLPQSEPARLKKWAEMDLYQQIRRARAGAPRFILHDGPPYANADIHLGTALNKNLKDFVVKSRPMLGYDAPYVPAYDCHGLPTALAEAEVEYRQHNSPSVYVKFPLRSDPAQIDPALAGRKVFVLIWTTTPWTLPANLGITVHPDYDYVAVESGDEVYIVAAELLDVVAARCNFTT